MRRSTRLTLGLVSAGLMLGGCFEDPVGTTTTTETSGDGDGEPATGDGDGDSTTTGDGDGDPATGDGDGDGEPGPLGTYRWHIDFPGFPNGIGIHDQAMLMTGTLNDGWDGPGGVLVPEGPSDLLLLGFTVDGEALWAKNTGGPAADFPLDTAFYAQDRVAISTVYIDGPTNYGGEDFPDGGGVGLAGFAGAGDHAWSLPILGDASAAGLDVDGSLKLILSGRAQGIVAVAGQLSPSLLNDQSYYLRLELGNDEPMATVLRDYGGINDDEGLFAEHDGLGGIYLGGVFENATTIDGTMLDSAGARDAYIARVDNAGDAEWVAHLSSPGDIALFSTSSTNDAAGNLLFGGSFEQTLSFDGAMVAQAQGGRDGFVLRVTPTGEPDQVWILGSVGTVLVRTLAVGPQGELAFGFEASGGVEIGGEVLPAIANLDAGIVRYDSAGEQVWAQLFGSPGDDRVNAIAFDGEGRLYAGLSYVADLPITESIVLENDTGGSLSALVAFE